METAENQWEPGQCEECQKITLVGPIILGANRYEDYCIHCMEIIKDQCLTVLAQRAVSN
jgi:hypothetical protein